MIKSTDVGAAEPDGEGRNSTPANPDLVALDVAPKASPHPGRYGEMPWRVVARDHALALYVVRLCEEGLSDAANASILMGCGGAIENMRLAISHAGFCDEVAIFPRPHDGALVAMVRAGQPQSPRHEEEAIFRMIAEDADGRTSDGSIPPRPTPALVALLRHAARTRGSWIDVIADDCRLTLLADLVAQAAALSDAGRGSRQLFSFVSASPLSPVLKGEYDRLGLEHLFGALGGRVRPAAALTRLPKEWPGAGVLEAPLLLVLGTSNDGPEDWVSAGAALQRVLLHAAAQRMTATFFIEPMRHPLVRDQLRRLLFTGGEPHAIVRLDFD